MAQYEPEGRQEIIEASVQAALVAVATGVAHWLVDYVKAEGPRHWADFQTWRKQRAPASRSVAPRCPHCDPDPD
jgi:hypothetical protein